MTRIGAVVLAAGEASRFGAPKQRLLLPDVLAALAASRVVEDVVVVEGAHPLELSSGSEPQRPSPRLARCPNWALGPGASLRCGLEALTPQAEAAVVVLADGPDLDPRAVVRVVEAWRAGAGTLLAATYDGRSRSHPLLLERTAWADVPDEGLRAREPALVPCDDLADPGDVDRPGDLPERLR